MLISQTVFFITHLYSLTFYSALSFYCIILVISVSGELTARNLHISLTCHKDVNIHECCICYKNSKILF